MTAVHAGADAPDFTLTDQNGTPQTLSKYHGKWVLLYFYPKDDTPGCTKEACAIRDSYPDFKKLGITVLGVSTDDEESHKKFAAKYELPFTLLADPDKHVVTAYGVYGKKKFAGHEYVGTSRTSFLIDPTGKIAKVYESVQPEIHADEVLRDLPIFAN